MLDLTLPVWEGAEEGNGGQYSDGAFHSSSVGGQRRRAFIGLRHEDKTLVFRVLHAFPNLITYSRGDL